MWLWAIFIGGSGGINLNSSNGFDDISRDINNSSEFSTDPVLFFMDNIVWFIAGAIVVLFIFFIFWILSCVSRWGLIGSISEIQDDGKPKRDKIREIWKKGENGLGKVFLLDIIVILFWIIAIGIVTAILGIIAYTLGQFIDLSVGFAFLMLVILPFIFVIIVFSAIVKYVTSISTVIMALENGRPLKSIKKALHLVRYGYREIGKIFLMRILLGFISMGLSFTFFVILVFIGIFIAMPFIIIVVAQDSIFENIIFSLITGGVGIMYLAFFIISIIVLTSIFKLVSLDLWVWWVKRNMPSLREKKIEQSSTII